MKKIDRYIIKKYLGTFLFSIALFMLIIIIFDISEKIDDFLDKKAPIKAIIFDYYFNFIPFFANLFAPLFAFIAVIFFTSKMANNTEIISILNAGVSFGRLSLPYLFSASIILCATLFLSNHYIPNANKERIQFENQYFKNRTNKKHENNIHMQIAPGEFVYIDYFNSSNLNGRKFSIEKFNGSIMQYKLIAESIKYDTTAKRWDLYTCIYREFDGINEKFNRIDHIDTVFNFVPIDIKSQVIDVTVMNRRELRDFIKVQKERGSENLKYYMVEEHNRISTPFTIIILTLIGYALASRKLRGGIGIHLAIGITLSFVFILLQKISTSFGAHSDLPPMLAAWIPNIVFIPITYIIIKKAPK